VGGGYIELKKQVR